MRTNEQAIELNNQAIQAEIVENDVGGSSDSSLRSRRGSSPIVSDHSSIWSMSTIVLSDNGDSGLEDRESRPNSTDNPGHNINGRNNMPNYEPDDNFALGYPPFPLARRQNTPERDLVTPEGRPITPGRSIGTPEWRPNTPERRPNTPEWRPNTPERLPNTPDRRPNTPEWRPNTPDRRPNTPEWRPNTPERLLNTPRPSIATPDWPPNTPGRSLEQLLRCNNTPDSERIIPRPNTLDLRNIPNINMIRYSEFMERIRRTYQPYDDPLPAFVTARPSLPTVINAVPPSTRHVIELPPFHHRILAQLIDLFLTLFFMSYMAFIVRGTENYDIGGILTALYDQKIMFSFSWIMVLVFELGKIVLNATFEVYWSSSTETTTPGKRFLNLQVVSVSDYTKLGGNLVCARSLKKAGFRTMCIRIFYKYLLFIFFPVTIIQMALGCERTMHDYLSGTLVAYGNIIRNLDLPSDSD